MTEPQVSIVIPTYNREASLRSTLRALQGQRTEREEIILVDQTPAHEPVTARLIKELSPPIRHLRLERPSLTAARNAGIAAARGQVVLFLDDDVIPGPDLAGRHMRNYVDPLVGAVAGRMHAGEAVDANRYPWPDGPDIFDRNAPGERAFARGCNMSFRKDLILRAGGFDERYVGNAVGEEEDLCFGIRRLGARVFFDPEAWVIHVVGRAGGCREQQGDVGESPTFYRNKVYFALKNVAGLDFWRVLWDTYRTGTWRDNTLNRHRSFIKGMLLGWRAYRQARWRLERLSYTRPDLGVRGGMR